MNYATKVFENLPPTKQRKVLSAAAAEFAQHGYDAANTNQIAKRAGISVGSLFQYFRTKRDVFLAVIDDGTNRLLAPVLEKAKDAPDVFTLFRLMLEEARDFALAYPDENRIYLKLTADTSPIMATSLARRIESLTIGCYRRAMRRSREQGLIREGLDDGFAAFQMDSLVLLFQFSFASDYYRERLFAYTALDPEANSGSIIDALCYMAQKLLLPEKG